MKTRIIVTFLNPYKTIAFKVKTKNWSKAVSLVESQLKKGKDRYVLKMEIHPYPLGTEIPDTVISN